MNRSRQELGSSVVNIELTLDPPASNVVRTSTRD